MGEKRQIPCQRPTKKVCQPHALKEGDCDSPRFRRDLLPKCTAWKGGWGEQLHGGDGGQTSAG